MNTPKTNAELKQAGYLVSQWLVIAGRVVVGGVYARGKIGALQHAVTNFPGYALRVEVVRTVSSLED